MATVEKSDLLERASWTATSGKGKNVQRSFLVTGLDGNVATRQEQARLTTGVPQLGDPHPAGDGHVATTANVEFVVNSPTQAFVDIIYTVPDRITQPPNNNPATKTIGVTVTEVETNVDANGNDLEVFYTPNVTDESGNTGPGETVSQVAEYNKQQANVIITYTRKENTILNNLEDFVGTINSASFDGFAERRLFCLGIEAATEDRGATYDMTYTFQFKKEGWNIDVVYHDPDSGQIPTNPIPSGSNGIRNYRIYDQMDFNQLGII